MASFGGLLIYRTWASSSAFLQGKITWLLLGQGMTTAIMLGKVGGLYPAWRAANLSLVKALRYE